ncbi:MAG: hypothetical protein ABI601_12775 [bacterium]
MSLNGISNGYAQRPLAPQHPAQTVRDQGVARPDARQIAPPTTATPNTSRAAAAALGAAPALPVEAPPGTDPALWSILSVEERSFFAKSQAMGPLTYGRKMTERLEPPMPAVRGGRLDIRG